MDHLPTPYRPVPDQTPDQANDPACVEPPYARATIRQVHVTLRPTTWIGKLVLAAVTICAVLLVLLLSAFALALILCVAVVVALRMILRLRAPR